MWQQRRRRLNLATVGSDDCGSEITHKVDETIDGDTGFDAMCRFTSHKKSVFSRLSFS